MNDLFQSFKPKSLLVISLQSVPTFLFYLSELILPNSGLGKDWADFPLTHSNNHFELRTYSFCFLNRLTIYNQILLRTPSALLCCVEGGRVIIQLFQNDI